MGKSNSWWNGLSMDVEVGTNALCRAMGKTPKDLNDRLSQWWEWTLGFTLFFGGGQ